MTKLCNDQAVRLIEAERELDVKTKTVEKLQDRECCLL